MLPGIIGIAGRIGSPFTAEALALFARMTNQPSPARAKLIDNFFTSLSSGSISGSNVLSKIAGAWATAGFDNQSSLLDWRGTYSGIDLTVSGNPSFVADRGWSSDTDASSVLISNLIPTNAGANYNNQHLCVVTLDTGVGGYDIGCGNSNLSSGSNNITVNIGDKGASYPNQSIPLTLTVSSTTSGVITYARTTQLGNAGVATAYAPSDKMGILNYRAVGNSSYAGKRRVAFATVGLGLSAAEVADLYNAIKAYLTAVGVTGL